jgi:hypothetical protein
LGGAGLDFSNIVLIFHLYSMPNVSEKFGTATSAAQAKSTIECGLVIAKFRPFLRTVSSESDRTCFDRFTTNYLWSEEEVDKFLLRSEFNMEKFLMWLTFCT